MIFANEVQKSLLFHISIQHLYPWPWHKKCSNGMCWFHSYWEASWYRKGTMFATGTAEAGWNFTQISKVSCCSNTGNKFLLKMYIDNFEIAENAVNFSGQNWSNLRPNIFIVVNLLFYVWHFFNSTWWARGTLTY